MIVTRFEERHTNDQIGVRVNRERKRESLGLLLLFSLQSRVE